MREIEIKIKVKDLKAVEQKLREKGCNISEPIEQHDVIYASREMVERFEVSKEDDLITRIRQLPNKTILTLKQQRSNEMDNLEYETEISDPKEMHQILLTLGQKPVTRVNKQRRTCKLEDYEICLDEIEGLGTFVEFEKLTSEDADPDQVRAELFQAAESLGLSRADEVTKGYDTQIYLKNNLR